MKKKLAKIAALSMAAVSLVLVTVLVTVAFLTSSSKVENTFTVGDVGIYMYESSVDTNGKAIADTDKNGNMKDSDRNQYRLVPGKTYDKDPTIYIVEKSEDSFLFVKINNGIADIEASNNKISAQMEANGWKIITSSETESVYVYANTVGEREHAEKVKALDSEKREIPVFESFTLKNDAKVEDYDQAAIVLCAYAIQADTFLNTEEGVRAAWNAVKDVETP